MTNRPARVVFAATVAAMFLMLLPSDARSAAPPPASRPAAAPAAAKPAEPAVSPPSQVEIADDLAAGRHEAVLRKVRVALELKGPDAKGYDRAALLRARGEALLRTKQADAAARAFEDAAWETTDPAARAEGLATALLVRRANAGLQYVGRRPDPQDRTRTPPPADVVGAESRKRATAILFADELAANRKRIEAAAASTSLKDALDLMPALHDLAALERTATGGTETTADLATGFDARIATHLEEAAASLKQEVEGHAAHALAAVPQGKMYKQRGLGDRAGRVREIARLADGMRNVCVGCEDLYAASDRDFPGLRKRIERTRDLARYLLGRDYGASYGKPWQNPFAQAAPQPQRGREPAERPEQPPPGQPPPMGRRVPR